MDSAIKVHKPPPFFFLFMIRVKKILCIFVLLVFISMPKAMAQPVMPCVFWGHVYVGENSDLAPDGLNVTAVIRRDTNLRWTKLIGEEMQPGHYKIMIDPRTSEKDGGVSGDIIDFYIEGVKTNQTGTFTSGSTKQVDLYISEIPEKPGSTSNPYPLDIILIVIVIGIGSVTVFGIYKKGYRIEVSKKTKNRRSKMKVFLK